MPNSNRHNITRFSHSYPPFFFNSKNLYLTPELLTSTRRDANVPKVHNAESDVTVTFKSLHQLVQPPLTFETPRAIINMRWTSYLRTHERHPNTLPASCAHAVSAWCLLLQYSPEAARRG